MGKVQFTVDAVLLDIEGTASSIAFVHDILFPFARDHLASFVEREWESAAMMEIRKLFARDAGHDDFESWEEASNAGGQKLVVDEALRLMDGDVKATGLKQLQGRIWKDGYERGELTSHVYDDVPPALARWREVGIEISIYSSGSVEAQKLFFAHTAAGDLLPRFHRHYDTRIGGKKEPASYAAICEDLDVDPARLLFVSDSLEELDVARASGLQTALSVRPGNPPLPQGQTGHPRIESFEELELSR